MPALDLIYRIMADDGVAGPDIDTVSRARQEHVPPARERRRR
jgi:hypothetical protein